ncbi:hypothetical protein QBZ16_001745 [Prototheca wickerhamii]|uniref:WW domain-containing protein n=1 Tax=Prototheca wickerhamii TaxID=3111 RepID=A0AAD9IG24_PROWI|nr:hypothetical protein QBZ16_001745 [Prototheca wickerhamii]
MPPQRRSGPGNEIECELVAWRLERGAPPRVRWARCAWRRGTVPIWWGVNLASLQKGLAAEVYIRERDPYKGTASYFRRAARAGGGDEALGVRIPITCVNLLHCNPAKASELLLSSHFQESMRAVRRKLPAGAPIRVVNFDWHGNVGRLGEEKGIEGFWSFMEPFLKETGFSAGVIQEAGKQEEGVAEGRSERVVNGDGVKATTADPDAASERSDANSADPAPAPLTWWPPAATVRWESRQRGILRYNCADSLDRTNAATCFGSLPVLQEMLRAIDVDIAGWELRWHEGRPLYVDHIRRRTQWEAPAFAASGGAPRAATPEAPRFFRFRDLAEVRAGLRRDVLAEYAEAFRLHGDVHSFLYTGSPAMHSQVLGLLTGGARLAAGGVGKLQNLAVALQRRWNNTVSDGARQASLLLFLGLRLREQFPRLRLIYADACREVEEEAEEEDLEIAQQLSRLELQAAEERRGGGAEPETPDLLTLLDDPPQTPGGGGDSNGGARPEQASSPLLDPLGALAASDSASPPPRERLRSFALSDPDSPPDLLL